MKKSMFILLCFFSLSCFAKVVDCPLALATDDANFCDSFRTAAKCRCTEAGVLGIFCHMGSIYTMMMTTYGSLENACASQHETPTQTCIDDWNCYRSGGTDSAGHLCSATGEAC